MLNQDNFAYFRGLLEHKLLLNRCDDCGYWIIPPRPLCPRCWSRSITPTEASGKGTVFVWTVLHQGRPMSGFEYPHLSAAVELAERPGLRYLAPLVEVAPEDVHEGMVVELVWVDTDEGPIAAFRPEAR
jgi:uncharacterized OB-fold protein